MNLKYKIAHKYCFNLSREVTKFLFNKTCINLPLSNLPARQNNMYKAHAGLSEWL